MRSTPGMIAAWSAMTPFGTSTSIETGGSTNRQLGARADAFPGHARMDGDGASTAVQGLHDHPLRPRQPRLDLLGEAVVARDHPDRDAPGAEDERVQAVLAGRPPVQSGLDRRARVGMG